MKLYIEIIFILPTNPGPGPSGATPGSNIIHINTVNIYALYFLYLHHYTVPTINMYHSVV